MPFSPCVHATCILAIGGGECRFWRKMGGGEIFFGFGIGVNRLSVVIGV